MDGIINFNKPTGISSAKALNGVRSVTRVRKSGHAGTLDPSASGVLVLCLGRATKLVEKLMDHPKVYRATARLDVTSPGYDIEGQMTAVPVSRVPGLSDVQTVCARLEGRIQQVPPLTSALKIDGRPAYKHARAGQTLELKPRTVEVYWLRVHNYAWPNLEFEVACGRGTYVRALIRDIGEALGTGGCLTSLVRTAVGPFRLAHACTLEDLERSSSPTSYVIPLDDARELLEHTRVPDPPAHCRRDAEGAEAAE